jgi:CHAD domain-containing protein
MDSRRLIRLNTSLQKFLVHGPIKRSHSAHVPILEAGPEVVAHGYRRVVAIGDHIGEGSPPQALHALRMRAKRLRYTVEFLEPIYGKPARAYAKRLVALQDVLGRHQDDVVAIATLREIAVDPPQKIGPALVFALGTLAERYRADALATRAHLPKRYRAITADRWRRLRRTMEDLRPTPPEAVASEQQAAAHKEPAAPISIVRGLP